MDLDLDLAMAIDTDMDMAMSIAKAMDIGLLFFTGGCLLRMATFL
jgi:hypothetical protein